MNKKITTFSLLIGMIFSVLFWTKPIQAGSSDEFRVAMEAGYAPFNWTQIDDSNGAVPIFGSKEYAGGYDVEISKIIAEKLGKKLVIVKTEWDGLPPALTSGKVDAIIAGMSPTAERKKEVDFTDSYYDSHLVMMVRADGQYAHATKLTDFKNAKITGQLNTFHYEALDQIIGANKQPAMDNFPAMRVALEAGTIDGYISERPEGVTATSVNPVFHMIEFEQDNGFVTTEEDTAIAVGIRKNDDRLTEINAILAEISAEERNNIMDLAIKNQPVAQDDDIQSDGSVKKSNPISQILTQYGPMFLRGTWMTLFLALTGTIIGTMIGLLIGVYRTIPEPDSKWKRSLYKIFSAFLSIYIEIFRGTPMIVQAAVIYYGSAQAFGFDMNRTLAALIIVSINTGAYMSEIVRGGIYSVDSGQFEAAQAIGMTHGQTMFKVVLPQVLRNIMPATGNEFVINIKDTSVLSIISVSELFFQGKSAAGATYQFFPTYFIISVIYFILTFTVTRILRYVEKRMDGPANYIPYANQEQVPELNKSATKGGQ